MTNNHKILITVDLEDWFQVENLRKHFPRKAWCNCQIRVDKPTEKLLTLFKKYDVKATFFVLGWLAERFPELISKIWREGHEIASHGYGHDLCYDLDEDELFRDVKKCKGILEKIIGNRVMGYRAPSFSIHDRLIPILQQAGFAYDSSYNDFSAHGRYGSISGNWKKIKPGILRNENGFLELPVSNLNIFGKTIPWGGGGYFRLMPVPLFMKGVKRILKKNGSYLFYCHPWEFDPGQPQVKGLRPGFRFRHYVNISRNIEKFDAFLASFSNSTFMTCRDFLRKTTDRSHAHSLRS